MKNNLYIYDTKIREKIILKPAKDNKILMYTCGPTVYNYAHIGNLRTYIFEDLLRRTIKFFGMDIHQVMNLTDVDDKTIQCANANGIKLSEYTEHYTKAFLQDLKILNVEPVENYPRATDYIDSMIVIISKLIEKGIAYIVEGGSVFYRISKFPSYGALSHFNLNDLKSGASESVNEDEYEKESISDFVLWKGYDKKRDGDIFWESPWGNGRPGWHIECSAMAIKCLGETIDLHVGGVDNIFPHHENEIAQSEGYTGKQFSRHWMHSAHLIVDGKKMSKSLGNFFTLNDLLKNGFSGRDVRYLLMSTHYRSPLNFTFAGLDGAKNAIRRIDDFINRLNKITNLDLISIDDDILDVYDKFTLFIGDDLNISGALGVVFDFIRKINSLCDKNELGTIGANKILTYFKKIDLVLGLIQHDCANIPDDIQIYLVQRNKARAEKKWQFADELRDKIELAGYTIEDSQDGSYLRKK